MSRVTTGRLRVIETALARGWRVERTADGRPRLVHPNGAHIVFGREATAPEGLFGRHDDA